MTIFQAPLPVHPDDQKSTLIREAEEQMKKPVRPEDLDRIRYYLNDVRRTIAFPRTKYIFSIWKVIKEEHIPPIPEKLITKAKRGLSEKYKKLEAYQVIYEAFESEIEKFYSESTREYTLRYVLEDPYEWERLKIETFPMRFPVITIRSPVPWHITYQIGSQALERRLFIGNAVLIHLRDLWETKWVLNYFVVSSIMDDLHTMDNDFL